MKNILAKIGLAGTTSLALTESLNLNTLYNALITLAISICSVLAVEGVNWLKNWFINHTKNKKEDNENKEE